MLGVEISFMNFKHGWIQKRKPKYKASQKSKSVIKQH